MSREGASGAPCRATAAARLARGFASWRAPASERVACRALASLAKDAPADVLAVAERALDALAGGALADALGALWREGTWTKAKAAVRKLALKRWEEIEAGGDDDERARDFLDERDRKISDAFRGERDARPE